MEMRRKIVICHGLVAKLAFFQMSCSGMSSSGQDNGTDSTDTESSTETESEIETDTEETCYEGDIIIENDEDMLFFKQYDCITGSLSISAAGAEEIDLPKLKWIGKSLDVGPTDQLYNLDGIGNLEEVGNILLIANNSMLEEINGLSKLNQIKEVYISGNGVLGNVDGLSGVKEIENRITIRDNYSLKNLSGLDGVVDIVCDNIFGPCLQIFNNTSLPQCEACDFLLQLDDFSGSFSFANNMADSCSDTCI